MSVLVTSCKWRPGYSRVEIVFSFYHVDLGNRTQIVMFAGHLTGPGFCISIYSLLVTIYSRLLKEQSGKAIMNKSKG